MYIAGKRREERERGVRKEGELYWISSPHLLGNSTGTHLWLQVIGRDLWRRHHNSVLAWPRLLDTAVEEEGHVCVLLRLCAKDVKL